ncbi:hypothetical protein BH20ACI2_BH20ACI2_15130 [soil metagenome]
MNRVITISPEIQSGEPVFTDTRVPIKNLFDYLKGGESIHEFLTDFPSVKKEQVVELLGMAEHTFTFSESEIYEESIAR